MFGRLNRFAIRVVWLALVVPLDAADRGLVRLRNGLRRFSGLPPIR